MRLIKHKTHKSLAQNDAPLQLALLGVLAGVLAGLVVNLFRFVLEAPFPLLGITADHDDFESLPALAHFLLPLGGSLVLAAVFHFVKGEHRRVGVPHVIDKVQNFKGYMPQRNAWLQFFGAAIALLSGHSVGREGPAIHLGAGSSSLLGQVFHLPNNSSRTLLACGSAAAIAASFNTPIAGVIFTMEVIMMEYSIAGFIPVITAAVSGAVITQLIHGNMPVFIIEEVSLNSLWELPYVVMMGVVIGVLASVFIRVQKFCMSYASIDLRKRVVLAGVLTGGVAVFIPQILGMGYDTLNEALQQNLALRLLLPLLAAKLLITAVALGLGVPGGVIGPTLMIGGLAGAVLGITGEMALSSYDADPALYTLLGMCAMMGAVLQAPLAALMAMLELSSNPNLILPGMLIIVVANLTAGEVFGLQSIFQLTLQQHGIKTPKTLTRLLNRYGVSAILDHRVASVDLAKAPPDPRRVLEHEARWVVLGNDEEKRLVDASRLEPVPPGTHDFGTHLRHLFEQGEPLHPISLQATLQEAMEALQNANREYGYVYSTLGFSDAAVLGIVSVDDIIAFYRDR